jgi:DNA-binding winged helix-turn-helix (wHTH) protein
MDETASLPDYDFSEARDLQTNDTVPDEPRFPTRYLRFGTFELDLEGQTLCHDGTSIVVQGKLYKTLLALLENPGEIVFRDVLQARLWPGKIGIDRGSNLNTTVNKLRRVLHDTDPGHPVIKTIHRTGYLFTAKIEYAHHSMTEDRRQETNLEKKARFSWTRASESLSTSLGRVGFRGSLIVLLIAAILFGAGVALYAHRPLNQP